MGLSESPARLLLQALRVYASVPFDEAGLARILQALESDDDVGATVPKDRTAVIEGEWRMVLQRLLDLDESTSSSWFQNLACAALKLYAGTKETTIQRSRESLRVIEANSPLSKLSEKKREFAIALLEKATFIIQTPSDPRQTDLVAEAVDVILLNIRNIRELLPFISKIVTLGLGERGVLNPLMEHLCSYAVLGVLLQSQKQCEAVKILGSLLKWARIPPLEIDLPDSLETLLTPVPSPDQFSANLSIAYLTILSGTGYPRPFLESLAGCLGSYIRRAESPDDLTPISTALLATVYIVVDQSANQEYRPHTAQRLLHLLKNAVFGDQSKIVRRLLLRKATVVVPWMWNAGASDEVVRELTMAWMLDAYGRGGEGRQDELSQLLNGNPQGLLVAESILLLLTTRLSPSSAIESKPGKLFCILCDIPKLASTAMKQSCSYLSSLLHVLSKCEREWVPSWGWSQAVEALCATEMETLQACASGSELSVRDIGLLVQVLLRDLSTLGILYKSGPDMTESHKFVRAVETVMGITQYLTVMVGSSPEISRFLASQTYLLPALVSHITLPCGDDVLRHIDSPSMMQLYSASFAAALGFLAALVDEGGKVETNDCVNVLSAIMDGDMEYKIVIWSICHFLNASREVWMPDNRAKVDVLCDAVDMVREVLLSELETHVACTMLPAVNYTLQALMNGKETTALVVHVLKNRWFQTLAHGLLRQYLQGSCESCGAEKYVDTKLAMLKLLHWLCRHNPDWTSDLATHSKSLSKDLQKALEIAISKKDTTSIALIYPVIKKMSETEKGDTWSKEMTEVKVRLHLPDSSGDSEIDGEEERKPFRIWRPYSGSAGVLLTDTTLVVFIDQNSKMQTPQFPAP
ncbi:hypothetical protein G7K_2497-t2 [Saitoella complicata NRRL Y-17804]|uniref:Uncharacterized protein n=1 Tax=Saitoella complicata (strain BCRC 22490 / CBS 7301 / JCM 7358 / NBRC 10748 / NRRL Y-17804) TaxID=698492 RepID=A0A0E9NF26_SAICN|nr:hypothetical protein G7K_2497-t2 [Saitoella complicata NRRL Y-17804]